MAAYLRVSRTASGVGQDGSGSPWPCGGREGIDHMTSPDHDERPDDERIAANKAAVRGWLAAYDANRLDLLEPFFDPGYLTHNAASDIGFGVGFEAVRRMMVTHAELFADGTHHVVDQVAEGDLVATRIEVTGRHVVDSFGVRATGRSVAYGTIALERVVDGRIVESWSQPDLLALMTQVGAVTYVPVDASDALARSTTGPQTTMATGSPEPRLLVGRFWDGVDHCDRAALADVVSASFVEHGTRRDGETEDRAGLDALVAAARERRELFGAGRHSIRLRVEEADRIATLMTVELDSGQTADEIAIHKVTDGRISEVWSKMDRIRVLQATGRILLTV
jgi:predicted ester cyclase